MTTKTMRAKFIFDMFGNIRSKARADGRALDRMGRQGERSFNRLGRAADRMNTRLNRFAVRGAQFGAVAGIAATAVAVKRLGTLEERLARLGNEAGKSVKEMDALRDAVNAVSNDRSIRIDPSQLLGALEQIQEMTGNLDFGMAIKREMAIAIQATGQAGPVIGQLVSSMYDNMGIRTADGMRQALDILTLQGRGGKFTIPNFAAQGSRLLASYGAFDRGGIQGITEAGALVQRIRQGTGSTEEATTAFQAILRTFLDSEKIKKINTVGADDKVAPNLRFKATDAHGNVRSPIALLKDLISSSGGSPVELSKLFDSEAMKGILPIAAEFRKTGGFPALDKLLQVTAPNEVLTKDSANIARGLNATAQSVANQVNDAVEDNLIGPLTKLTESINALLDAGIELTADDALNLALTAAGVGLGVKGGLWALGRGGRRPATGKVGRAGTGAGLMTGVPAGVVPVYVTNLGGAGIGGGDVDRRGKGKPGARNRGSAGSMIGKGARAVPLLGTALVGADMVGDLLPAPNSPSARGVLSGIGGFDPSELARRLGDVHDAARDGVSETADSTQAIVAELRQLQVVVRNLQQRDRVAIGPAPETGRILEGPQ